MEERRHHALGLRVLTLISLEALGWSSFFEAQLDSTSESSSESRLIPARVLEDRGQLCQVHGGSTEFTATLGGRLRHERTAPVAGDWVLLRIDAATQEALVVRVLRRRTTIGRKAAGRDSREQTLAANVDTVWIVQSLDADFNVRRLERYLVAAREGGGRPVVVLNKIDLCAQAEARAAEAGSVAGDAPVHAIDALHERGLDSIRPYLRAGETVALVGSSGVGKSTLVNRLAGAALQRVHAVRESDGKGRHTTTSRRLLFVPGGGMLLDTPGMRELGLAGAGVGLEATFSDIDDLALGCRFRDCRHEGEPGCEVRAALATGALDAERYASRLKLQGEARHAAVKQDLALQKKQKLEWRKIHREMRARTRKPQG